MGYRAEGICIDCGKKFIKYSEQQIRCKECHEAYRKERDKERYRRKRNGERIARYGETIYRNGHPQICQYTKACYYGGSDSGGCSYLLETGKSRVNQGHYIVDGKCDLFEPRNGRMTKRQRGNMYFGRREKDGEDT